MRPWLKRTLVGLFGAGILFGGLAACSHRMHGPMGWQSMNEEDAQKFKTRMVERVGDKLQLDAAQKAKLATLADRLREQRKALAGESADPRADLKALIAGERFDRDKARGLVEAKTEAVRGKSPEVIAAAADFFDSLKPEQQQKVREFMERGRGWHRG